jgi:hypothetical protein
VIRIVAGGVMELTSEIDRMMGERFAHPRRKIYRDSVEHKACNHVYDVVISQVYGRNNAETTGSNIQKSTFSRLFQA